MQNAPKLSIVPAIDSADRARALSDEAAAGRAGFSLKPPIYAIGTAVNAIGVKNFRQSRRDFEDLPLADDACTRLAAAVVAEDRADELVEAPSIEMLETGQLRTPAATYALSERGFDGLCRAVTPGGAGYLTACPRILRAWNVNHWLAEAYDKTRQGLAPSKLVLRTRRTEQEARREVFAAVGPRYTPHDIDAVARQVAAAVPPEARADVVYDGYRVRINVLWHSNIEPERCVAGEIFKAGVLVTTADDGSGAIRISAEVWRNLCRNLIILDRARIPLATRRHIGRGIANDVEAGIQAALAKVATFADKWSEASLENVLERYGVDDVATVFRALVQSRVVHVPGVAADDMVERLQRAWDFEPGYSRAAVVNAITRAAHTEEWRSWTTAEDLERTAGELLYARVWNVQQPEA